MHGILIGQDLETSRDIFAFEPRPDSVRRVEPVPDRVRVEVRIPRASVEWHGNYYAVMDGGTTVHTTNDYSAALRYAVNLNGEDV